MRHLVTVAALALCTSAWAQSVVLDTDSPVTSSTRIESNSSSSSSSVSSSTNSDTGVSTNSIVGRTGSMCSTVVAGKRCEIACQAPQMAQCGKGEVETEPSCVCR